MKKNMILLILATTLSFGNCKSGVDKLMEYIVFTGWTFWICNYIDPYNNNPVCQNVRNGSSCVECAAGTPGGAKTSAGIEIWIGNSPAGMVITDCKWTANALSNRCGSFDPGNDTCTIETCNKYGTPPKSGNVSTALMGYDITASDPPVGVKSIIPASNQIIYENQNIDIQFAGSVKSDTISFSGSMNPELNPNFRFRRTVDYNDTLPLAAGSKWSLGAAKTLTISVLDINDNPVAVPLLYHVIRTGSAKTPSFNDCSGGCKPGWQNAYSIQFNVTGGVPPYRWAAASSLPPEANVPSGSLPPGASMNQDGLLSGPATNNFMPNAVYIFGVAVIDSVGQMDVKIITIDTTDVGAQLAACLLLGLCG